MALAASYTSLGAAVAGTVASATTGASLDAAIAGAWSWTDSLERFEGAAGVAKSSAGRFVEGVEEALDTEGLAGGDFMSISFLLLAGSFVEEGAGAGARAGDGSEAPGVDV